MYDVNEKFIYISEVKYNKTSDYHWPEIELENENSVILANGSKTTAKTGKGPFGFGDSLEVAAGEVGVNGARRLRNNKTGEKN
jgi:hypothetical protein